MLILSGIFPPDVGGPAKFANVFSQWLSEDPVAFDKVRKEFKLKLDSKIFDILISKLKAYHFEYFRDSLGLNMRIDFKGYDFPVKANILFTDKPVEYYKWWCTCGQ
jgi:hypothetical protein